MSPPGTESLQHLLNDAVAALRAGKHNQAELITSEIIEQQDDHAGAYAVRFSSLFKAEKFEQARRIGGRAAELNPKSVFILNNQACLQLEAKQPAAASGLLKSLIEQYGEQAQWLYNLALAQRMVGNYDYSLTTFRRTLDLQPDHDRAAFQLADCLSLVGHKEEAIRAYDYVRLLRSKHAPSHSNYIHHAVANNVLTRTSLEHELHLWEARFIPQENRYSKAAIEDTNRVNIGFIIGTLPANWLESLVAPVINQLATGPDNITVYWHDETLQSQLFNDNVDMVDSPSFSDADFARRVRADGINIIVDLCGMRRGNRQRVLGMQLADRQFGWLAHEGRYATPLVEILDENLGQNRFFIAGDHHEKTERLPENTFAGIGCGGGLSQKVIKVWSEILLSLPDWKLHLDCTSNTVGAQLEQQFASFGVSHDRIISNRAYNVQAGSIVLDNFIENDPVSAMKAIINGGILVATIGDLFPAKQTAALLKQVEQYSFLCHSQADYINRALALANGQSAASLSDTAYRHSEITNLGRFVHRFRNAIVGLED